MLVLLGVGAFVLTAFAERILSMAREMWAMSCVAVGVGLAWLANFNLWNTWHLLVRAPWIGVTLTGLAIAAVAFTSYGVAHFVMTSARKLTGKAVTIESQEGLKRVA
jgi:hypothetical protein